MELWCYMWHAIVITRDSVKPVIRFYPNRAFLCCKNKGGGAHLLPFSESIQVKFFWKLAQKWVFSHNFGFHWNHCWSFKVVCSFEIFDWESPFKNQKTVFPLVNVNKSNFFWKHMKNQIKWQDSRCHGDSIAQFKVVEAWKRVRNENCHQDDIKGAWGISSPTLHNRLHLGHSSWK